MLDTKITGGVLVDGTGSPRRPADVGIRAGRIVAVGEVDEPAHKVIDADGRAVTPGFVDVHTHLDAQAFWDPDLSPSPLHGVTTAVAGNCGFTIAPVSPESAAYLMPMLARVEGMPLQSLRNGVPWSWSTTAEYLDLLDNGLAANVGFMVGHSAIRRLVMGEAANERTARPRELETMKGLLREGIRAGGMGFSTTTSETHNDASGRPVPSRFADAHEMVELARVCGDFEGTSLELLPKGATSGDEFAPDVAELMVSMSEAARRPINWNVISPTAVSLDAWLAKLAVGDHAQARGAKVVGLTMPVDMKARFSFHAGFVLDMFEGWGGFLSGPVEERLRILSDLEERKDLQLLAEGTAGMRHLASWGKLWLVETFTPETARYQGRSVGDIAEEKGCDPFDALVDIVIADGLRTTFARKTPDPTEADWEARAKIWRDPRAQIGASDAGAHLDMIAAFRYATGMLEEAVRLRDLLSLEETIHMLTGSAARMYGMVGRGVITEGAHADILVIDTDTVGSGPVSTRFDLPGGAPRLYADAIGIDHVIVGGVEVAAGGTYTGDRPGRILRAGVDTRTPTMAM
jgi:N-acyl-D-aspartate/D-glutamate deacylase